MSSTQKDLLRVLGAGLVECLLFFPVLFIPMVYLVSDSLIILWSCITVLGYGIGFAGSRWFRLNTFLKTCLWALIITVSISFFLFGTSLPLLIAIPSLFITCYRGTRMEQAGLFISGSYFIIAFMIYGFSSFVVHFIDYFQPYNQILTITGSSALIMALFIVNRKYVEEQTLPGHEKPIVDPRVRRLNVVMIIILLLLMLLLALLPVLQRWLAAFGRGTIVWIIGLFGTSSEEPEELPEDPSETSIFSILSMLNKDAEPSALAVFFEKIVFFLFSIGMILLILFLLYSLIKNLPKIIRKISIWVNRLMSRQEQDGTELGYEDEEIEIEHGRSRFKRLRFIGRRANSISSDDESGDNAAIIRRIYRRILIRNIREGYKWKKSQTPRETKEDMILWNETNELLSEDFIRLYEKARYGQLPIRDDELNSSMRELNITKE